MDYQIKVRARENALFQLLTIRKLGSRYELMGQENLDLAGSRRRPSPAAALYDLQLLDQLEQRIRARESGEDYHAGRAEILLSSLFFYHQEKILAARNHLNLPQNKTELMTRVYGETSTVGMSWDPGFSLTYLYINQYLEKDGLFKEQVDGLCRELGINPSYRQDYHTLAACLFLGPMIYPYGAKLAPYICLVAGELHRAMVNDETANLKNIYHERGPDSPFLLELHQIIGEDRDDPARPYMSIIELLQYTAASSSPAIELDLLPSIVMVHEIDDAARVTGRWLEMSPLVNGDLAAALLAVFNRDVNPAGGKDPAPALEKAGELFMPAGQVLQALTRNKYFASLPLRKRDAAGLREGYYQEREDLMGPPSELAQIDDPYHLRSAGKVSLVGSNQYLESFLQAVIYYHGMFGLEKRSAEQIIEAFNTRTHCFLPPSWTAQDLLKRIGEVSPGRPNISG